MNASFLIYGFVNTLFIMAVSPLFMSLIKKVKAYAQGRRGPPLLQGYYNLFKLLKKERVYSETSSQITRITPYISLASMVAASLFVPVIFIPEAYAGIGNVILFLYLLALGRFFTALAGLDAGSTFGGMGSSREMSLSAVVEPMTIIAFASLAFALGTANLHEMAAQVLGQGIEPALLLAAIPLFIALIAETARIPVDNPETHLELTMVHEAMILEYSGRDLAMMELAHAIKQTLLLAVLINLLFPWGLATGVSVAILPAMLLFVAKAGLLSAGIGAFESSIAKMRLFNLPNLFAVGFFFAVLTVLLTLFIGA